MGHCAGHYKHVYGRERGETSHLAVATDIEAMPPPVCHVDVAWQL